MFICFEIDVGLMIESVVDNGNSMEYRSQYVRMLKLKLDGPISEVLDLDW